MTTYPDLYEVKVWLNITDTLDDAVIEEGMAAAQAHQEGQLDLPLDGALPDDVRLAYLMRVQRYLARRNSPDGLLGFGEFTPARVSSVDPDIVRLESPHIRIAVA